MRQSSTRSGKPAARRYTHGLLSLALILLSLALVLPAGAAASRNTGSSKAFEIGAARTSGLGTIAVDSQPTSADARVDGVDAGLSTPATFTNLTPGAHQVRVTIPGFQPWQQTVSVTADATTTVEAPLLVALPAAVSAEVAVTTSSDALDGDASSIAALKADPGPDGISLREAITAANATAGTKVIRFAAALYGAVITTGLVTGAPLPALTGGGTWIIGDIDGDGAPDVTLDGVLGQTTPGPLSVGIELWSSGDVVSGLRFVNYVSAVPLAVPPYWTGPAKTFVDDRLLGNAVKGGYGLTVGPLGFITAGDPVPISNLTWSGLILAGNVVDGTGGILLYAGSMTSHDNRFAGPTISSNTVTGSGEIGVLASDASGYWAGVTGPVRYADHNTAQGVTIEHNRWRGDTGKAIEILVANMGNSDCAISDVVIRDNDIAFQGQDATQFPIGIALGAGAGAFTAGERATARDSLSHVEVRRNRIQGARRGIGVCISEDWQHALTAPPAGGAADNAASDIVVADNEIRDSREVGILAVAGSAGPGALSCRDTALTGLVITDNRLTNAMTEGVGIRLAGGISGNGGAEATGNQLTGASLTGNTVKGFDQGIWVSGGDWMGAVGNTLTGSSSGNSVSATEPWLIEADSEGASGNALSFAAAELIPKVTSCTPAAGPVGTSVTLTGSGFTYVTSVTFNGTAATVFSVNSATQIAATVPAAASTGRITVTTPGGSATSAASFTVTAPPVFTPTVTLRLSGLRSGAIRLGRSVTARGTVTPTSLAGVKVALTMQRKSGTRWVKVKAVTRTISSTMAYSWKFKPDRKGAYRVQAKIAKTAAHSAAKTAWRTFKVK